MRVEDTEFSQCKIGDRKFERAAGSTFRSSSTTTGMGHDGNPIATSTSAGGGAVPATASTTSARTKVGRNIQAFRMRLWNHHLGHPPHSTKTLDFASESTWDSITSTAKKNADALHDAFPGQFPHDSYQKWHTPKDSGDVEGGGAAAIGFVDAKLKWSEDMKKAKERGKKTMSTWEVCVCVCFHLFYSSFIEGPSRRPSPPPPHSSLFFARALSRPIRVLTARTRWKTNSRACKASSVTGPRASLEMRILASRRAKPSQALWSENIFSAKELTPGV